MDHTEERHQPTMRVLGTLRVLAQHPEGMSLVDIARSLGASKSTLLAVLRTMVHERFASYDKATQRYRLGMAAFTVGSRFTESAPLSKLLRDEMEDLVGKCGETCQLGVLEGADVFYILKVDSPAPIRLMSNVGMRLPAYRTALGKALLSDLTRDEVRELLPGRLERMTKNTLTSADAFYDDVERQRPAGIFCEDEESGPGVVCFAVPLCRDGEILAAASLSMPAFRMTDEKRARVRELLPEFKRRAESLLDAHRDGDDLFCS